MEPLDVVELRTIPQRRSVPPYVIVLALVSLIVLFGVLVTTGEPRDVAFFDSCLLVTFPLARFSRRRR